MFHVEQGGYQMSFKEGTDGALVSDDGEFLWITEFAKLDSDGAVQKYAGPHIRTKSVFEAMRIASKLHPEHDIIGKLGDVVDAGVDNDR